MKKYTIIGFMLFILFSIIGVQKRSLKRIKEERNAYQNNINVLMGDIERYKTKDSLNVVSVGQLNISLKELKKYRQEDAQLISTLQADNKRLKTITATQTETIYKLEGAVKDSIIYRDKYRIDTLKCIDIVNPWFTFTGCTNNNSEFTGQFINRDSLWYVEHIKPKKFLFFKWGVKERKQEILSKNPYTHIVNAEYITIRK